MRLVGLERYYEEIWRWNKQSRTFAKEFEPTPSNNSICYSMKVWTNQLLAQDSAICFKQHKQEPSLEKREEATMDQIFTPP